MSDEEIAGYLPELPPIAEFVRRAMVWSGPVQVPTERQPVRTLESGRQSSGASSVYKVGEVFDRSRYRPTR